MKTLAVEYRLNWLKVA